MATNPVQFINKGAAFSFSWLYCAVMLFIALIGISQMVYAAKKAPPPIAAHIQARYGDLNSIDADFEQTLTHKESGSVEKRKGHLLFSKPLLARWETAKPHEELLIITPTEVWDYLPDEDLAYKYSPNVVSDSRSLIQVITGQAALTKDFDVLDKGKENGLTKLQLYPKEPTAQMVEALVWVEPDSGFIKRAKIIDFYGNSNDVRFTSFSPGLEIAKDRFKFTPPKNVEVEDRTKENAQERQLFK